MVHAEERRRSSDVFNFRDSENDISRPRARKRNDGALTTTGIVIVTQRDERAASERPHSQENG